MGWLDALGGEPLPRLQGLLVNETNGAHIVGYLPWGLLCCAAVLHSRKRLTWGTMLVVAFTLSIGPEISLGATVVPMPHYLLGMHLVPFVERLWFPYRWIVVAMLAACMAAGILVSRLPSKWRGVAAMSAIGLGLYPQVRAGVYPLTATHWSMSPVYREIGEREGGVVELPLMVPRESLMFQPIHKQVLFGGMGESTCFLAACLSRSDEK